MTQIIPITKATKKMKPPLKKTELIEALAIRARAKFIEENAEVGKQLEAAKKAFYTEATAELVRKNGTIERYQGQPFDVSTRYDNATASYEPYSLDIKIEMPITPELRRAYKKIKALENKWLQHGEHTPLSDFKRQVREKLDGQPGSAGSRVSALLADPATLKALDATLEALNKPAQPALPAPVAKAV